MRGALDLVVDGMNDQLSRMMIRQLPPPNQVTNSPGGRGSRRVVIVGWGRTRNQKYDLHVTVLVVLKTEKVENVQRLPLVDTVFNWTGSSSSGCCC